MNISKSELAAIKLSLMTEHSTGTRGLTDEAIVSLAARKGVISEAQITAYMDAQHTTEQQRHIDTFNAGIAASERREQQQEAQPMKPRMTTAKTTQDDTMNTLAPTQPNADAMQQMTALMSQMFAQSSGGMTEHAVIELINKHAPVKRIEVATTSGATVAIDGVLHECFERALNILSVGNDLYFYGRSGAGKSHTSRQLAKALDVPFFSQGSILAKFEALGSLTANGYNKSVIRQWLESDGGLLCIDEIDGSCPRALVTIMSIFDENGRLTFPDGETLERTEKHRIVLTANTVGAGANAQYNGRARLDKATLNRFVYIEHDYSKQVEDSIADKVIVQFGRALRKEVEKKGLDGALITPRTFKQAQKVYASNLDIAMKKDLMHDCFRQALTAEQYSSVLKNIAPELKTFKRGA